MNKRTTTVRATNFYKEPQENGNLKLTVKMVVTDARDSSREVGDDIYHNMYLSDNDKTFEFASKTLRNLGMSNDSLTEPVGLGDIMAECVEVEDPKWGWQTKWINDINGRPDKKEVDPMVLSEFEERMAGFFMDAPVIERDENNTVTESEGF